MELRIPNTAGLRQSPRSSLKGNNVISRRWNLRVMSGKTFDPDGVEYPSEMLSTGFARG